MPRALRVITTAPEEPNGHVTLPEPTSQALGDFLAEAFRLKGLQTQPTHATVRRARAAIPDLRRLLDELESGLEGVR